MSTLTQLRSHRQCGRQPVTPACRSASQRTACQSQLELAALLGLELVALAIYMRIRRLDHSPGTEVEAAAVAEDSGSFIYDLARVHDPWFG